MLFVYSITLFVNAALLFIIEPMVAKMILPLLGGSPSVWNTSLAFYQVCLLIGYSYAHFGSRWLGTRRHALLHLNLLLAALLLLPVVLPIHWFASGSHNPVNVVLGGLATMVGLPFLVMSAGAPLLQKWFATCKHSAARDPYFLYAASNAGSIAGLLAYPLVLEPTLSLSRQNQLWFFSYLALLILMALCVLYFLRPLSSAVDEPSAPVKEPDPMDNPSREMTFALRLRCVVWSSIPSSLLLGVTSYVTTDIASAPLLWVLPLTAYLLTFVLAFARGSWVAGSFLARRQAFLLLAAAVTMFMHATEPDWIILPLHLSAFFLTSLVCHGQLAQERPNAKYLTEYYFWISLGGVLGGIFNALIAPVIFREVFEYPLAIAAAAFIRPYVGERRESKLNRRLDWLLPPAAVFLILSITLSMKYLGVLPPSKDRFLIFAASAVFCLFFAYRPVRFGVGMSAITVVALLYPAPFGRVLYADRSFFGTYRATFDAATERHVLFQGTTIHGAQSARQRLRLETSTYYHRTSPVGQVLDVYSKIRGDGNIAVVGLGTGALACFGTPQQKMTFYEIDPLVEKIARDVKLFTYLRDCPPKIKVVIGDARMSLVKTADHQYEILVLDAFSSDVIPTHLLTREALELYLKKLSADGILLVHISNRFMDLAPVLDRLATSLSLRAYIQNDSRITPSESDEGKFSSRWVMLARTDDAIAPFLGDSRWQRLDGELGGDLWTDDFSDVLKVISLR